MSHIQVLSPFPVTINQNFNAPIELGQLELTELGDLGDGTSKQLGWTQIGGDSQINRGTANRGTVLELPKVEVKTEKGDNELTIKFPLPDQDTFSSIFQSFFSELEGFFSKIISSLFEKLFGKGENGLLQRLFQFFSA